MFASPFQLFWGALAVTAAAGLGWLGASRREIAAAKMGRWATLTRLLPPELSGRRRIKAWLGGAGLALLFVALAGPQWGVELSPTESKAHEVVIAVDVSLSMLAEDVKPSRLVRAQEELSLLLDQLRGERVGVIAFAGDAYAMCPMTTDIDAAKQILRDLTPGAVPIPGTAIATAIRTAAQTLSRYTGEKNLVLITDGEDHKSNPLSAAAEAADAGVRIFAIGIGTPEGEPIPLKDSGGNLEGYKKDKRGATVVSKLGDKDLTEASQKTGGAFYRASPGQDEVTEIVAKIQKGAAGEAVLGTQQHFQNRFMIPLALAFVLLLLEFYVPERSTAGRAPPAGEAGRLAARLLASAADLRSSVARSLRSRAGKETATLTLLLLLASQAYSATAEGALRRGNKLYEKEQYEPALEQYAVAGQKSPRDIRPVFNAGDALYRLERYDEASETFKAIAQSKLPPAARASALYNLGDTRFQAGDYAGAIEAFRGAVVLDPQDAAARNNLAVALKRLKNPPPKKKDDKNKKNQDKDKKEKDKPKPQPSGGQSDQDKKNGNPPEPKTRPQDQMSREDAERIMRAVSDKEKSASKNLQLQKQKNKPPEVEEDW